MTSDAGEDPVIWRGDLATLLKVSSETIRRYIKEEKLPQPDVDLSIRVKGWRRSTLIEAGIKLP